MKLEPSSPVPLYHQIAEALRYRIATGKLRPGNMLPAVRDAASRWGVNMHTVRRSYGILADEGLVLIEGARGTRVSDAVHGVDAGMDPGLHRFVDRTVRDAGEKHGLTPEALARMIVDWKPAQTGEDVFVVECSDAQCASHAREIEAAWGVNARPWCLTRKGEPPAGPLVATLFHYNEIRRRWPHRLSEIQFVAIHPDPAVRFRFPRPSGTRRMKLLLCELDAAQADGAAADLSVIFPPDRYRIDTQVVKNAGEALKSSPSRVPVLLTPRLWAALSPDEQARHGVFPISYVIKSEDLEGLGRRLGWPRRARRGVSAGQGRRKSPRHLSKRSKA